MPHLHALPRPLKWPPVFPIDKNLELWLPFDDRSGSRALDRSGKVNHGTLSGGTWVASGRGSGLKLNGSSEFVTVADAASLRIVGDLSIELLIYMTNVSADYFGLVFKDYSHEYEVFGVADGSIRFYQGDGAFELVTPFPAGTLVNNVWTHLVAVRDLTDMKVYGYKNGVDVSGGGKPITKTPTVGTQDVVIGFRDPYYCPGIFKMVRIYSRVMTAEEAKRRAESELMLVRH